MAFPGMDITHCNMKSASIVALALSAVAGLANGQINNEAQAMPLAFSSDSSVGPDGE